MHETVIARRIIDDAQAQAKGKVKAITVGIGEVGPITIDDLRPTLTELVDWDVTFEQIPAIARCSCGYEGSPRILERGHDLCIFDCPKCSGNPQILQGKDIIIKRVTVV